MKHTPPFLYLFVCLVLCCLAAPHAAEAATASPALNAHPVRTPGYASDAPAPEDNASTLPSLDEDDEFLGQVGQIIPDPLEGWNRAMSSFNDVVIEYAARPLYKGYAYVTPQFMRTGISNFFHNTTFPVRFVNNLLQGRPKAAGVEMSRFILNTTAGLGGLFDVARHHKPIVEVEDEDMGQTFGVWGLGEGCYLVWPLLGPSTVRDSFGMVGDYFLDPATYLFWDDWGLSWGVTAVSVFNDLDDTLDLYDNLKRAAIEPYSSMRDAYVQYRRAKIDK